MLVLWLDLLRPREDRPPDRAGHGRLGHQLALALRRAAKRVAAQPAPVLLLGHRVVSSSGRRGLRPAVRAAAARALGTDYVRMNSRDLLKKFTAEILMYLALVGRARRLLRRQALPVVHKSEQQELLKNPHAAGGILMYLQAAGGAVAQDADALDGLRCRHRQPAPLHLQTEAEHFVRHNAVVFRKRKRQNSRDHLRDHRSWRRDYFRTANTAGILMRSSCT